MPPQQKPQRGGKLGDGNNEAPALTAANSGITRGSGMGSDVGAVKLTNILSCWAAIFSRAP